MPNNHGQPAPQYGKLSYAQHVIVAIALAGVILFLAAGLAWSARLLRISGLDAQALAEKAAFPQPASAFEWPELQVRSVVPESGTLSPVIVQVGWPAYPEQVSNLLVMLDQDDRQALSLLAQWSSTGASVAAQRQGAELNLRRRQSLDRVHATLLAEDYVVRK
jgi:hypothetical protein